MARGPLRELNKPLRRVQQYGICEVVHSGTHVEYVAEWLQVLATQPGGTTQGTLRLVEALAFG